MSNGVVRFIIRCVLCRVKWPLLLCFLCCFLFSHVCFAEEIEKIQYVSQQNNSITGTLVPDPAPGTVPAEGNPLIHFQIDGEAYPVSLSSAANGSASVAAKISGIKEGRHSARLISDSTDGSLKDSKEVLFIYDITPPDLELVFPESAELSRNALSFIVEFSDDGSGIPSQLEDIDVTATINGAAAAIETVENSDKRFFLIDYSGKTGVKGGVNYSLSLSLKDRAGNEATLEQSFQTSEVHQETVTEEKTCISGSGETFTFHAATRQDVSFPISNRISPVLFSRDNRSSVVALSINTEEKLDASILNSVTMSSSHPELKLERLPGVGNYQVRYRVEQQAVVSSQDALSYLVVDYPSVLSLEYEWECVADGMQMEPSLLAMKPSPDRDSFKVPVILYWKNSRTSETKSVHESDGSYFIEYLTWTEPSSQFLDTSASYLSFQNSAYFFDQQGTSFSSRAPVDKEGFYSFQVTLASAVGTWAHNGRPVGQEDHEFLFDLGGPVIHFFQYNMEESRLEAVFSDMGTPVTDLEITLTVDGFGKRDFEIQTTESGESMLVSPLPLPPSLVDAHLSISDLAQNNTERSCRIFGIPPDQSEDGAISVTDYALKKKDQPHQRTDAQHAYQVLSSVSGGLSLVRSCPVEKIIAVSKYSIRNRETLTRRKTTRYYPYQPYRSTGGKNGTLLYIESIDIPSSTLDIVDPVSGELVTVSASAITIKDQTTDVYSFEYCQNDIKDILPPDIRNITFSPAENTLTATISDHGRPASQVSTSLSVGVGVPSQFNSPVGLVHSYTPEQEPIISVSPSLSAPGMPHYSVKKAILASLEKHRVDRFFRKMDSSFQSKPGATQNPAELARILPAINAFIAYKEEQIDADATRFEGGHGLVGDLAAEIPLPPLVLGEKYDVTITASDSAGNRSYEVLELTAPRAPPVVSLELINTNSVSSFTVSGGGRSSTHLRASAVDESGLDLHQTYLELDSVRLSPLSSFGSGGLGVPPRNPNAYSMNELLKDSYKNSLLDEYVAHYSALLEEGEHRARFHATDILGLSAERQLDFTVEYLPLITNFVSKPKAIQDIGGPAFTALITDYGGDLEPSGISFHIDGKEVEKSKLYYDPASGYFGVSGPLEYQYGYHSAQITAVDSHNHRTVETLRFTVGEEITAVDGGGDLRLESINIWELEHKNNDGQANPGERIRIFPTLFNDTTLPLNNCTTTLFAEDSRLLVETNQINAGYIDAAVSTTLLRGFDLQIGQDILDATVSDPYETHLRLDVSCSDDSWELPFVLPIYRTSLPIDIDSQVTIELDRVSGSTTESETIIRGTIVSSSSYVDSLSMSVNGQVISDLYLDRATGEFEARVPLDPGSNIIEIEAIDRSGATGYATTFVNCRSSVIVTIDDLTRSPQLPELEIRGRIESSASRIERVVLSVNGREAPLRWHANQNRFTGEVVLEPGSNTIAVEAWDEAGSFGRAVEYVNYLGSTSQITINLDPLPPATSDATIDVSGTVTSSAAVDQVEVMVNGTPHAARYNARSRRFSATISLAPGGNSITAEAVSSTGDRATESAYVTRTVLFTPPSVAIASPAGGTIALCDPIVIAGTFDAGSSSVEGISVNTAPPFLDCRPVIIGAGIFSVECDVDLSEGDSTYTIEFQTIDGTTATDTVLIRTEGCG
jgi:uncharacterized protein YfaP (DUF2135 family)